LTLLAASAAFHLPPGGWEELKLFNLWNVINSAIAFYPSIGHPFLFMMTSAPINPSPDQLTLFAAASLVKISAPQASKPASKKAPAPACFTNLCESFAWWDPATSSWRTSQRSLLTDWTLFSERWPKQGMMRNGHVFRRQLWAPVIGEIGGGALPTPVASDGVGAKNATSNRKPGSKHHSGTTLVDWGRMLPTATTNDSKNASLPPSQSDRDGLAGAMLRDDSIQTGAATYLNPSFVEEMMGFPVGWTA
jgi:hypothetical protein